MFSQRLCRVAGAAVTVAAFASLAATPAFATPVTYDGVSFPGGDASFADQLYHFAPGSNTVSPHADGTNAVGAPDSPNGDPGQGYVSLGWGGTLDLAFTDNSLTTSGTAAEDLWIFEIGGQVEPTDVYISQNAVDWIAVGSVSGATAGVDIDAFIGADPMANVIANARYSYVRLVDQNVQYSGYPYAGADIDAVGAISSAPPVPGTKVPEPGMLVLLALGLCSVGAIGRRRRSS